MCQLLQTIFFILFIIEISTTHYIHQDTTEAFLPQVRLALSYERNSTSVNLCHYLKNNISCTYNGYSYISGYCNNFEHPSLGSTGDTFNRLLNPDYSDGISLPRTSTDMKQLPDPEIVAKEVQKLTNEKFLDEKINVFLPAWGILIAHDLIGISTLPSNLDCCSVNLDKYNILQCYVNKFNCKNYTRTSCSINEKNCLKYQREQMNTATSFLDASNIYEQNDNQKIDAYITTDKCSLCKEPGLVGELHKMLIRQHNRIAKELSEINSFSDQEIIFNESRKILIALIQHITFNEFIPQVLNQNFINKYGLYLQQIYSDKYTENIQPGTFNEFAVTAFSVFQSIYENYSENASTDVQTLLNKPAKYNSMHWNTTNPDTFSEFGFSVHQGRDHGIPSYLKFLNLHDDEQLDGLNSDESYANVKREITSNLYKNENDVDLLTGIMLERPFMGSIFGPTFSLLLALQFQNLRYSDRFWYENNKPIALFSKDQLSSIKSFSFSKLLCDTTNIKNVQTNGFLLDPNSISCDQIPGLNLQLWKSNDNNSKNKFKLNIGKYIISNAVKKAQEGVLLRQNFEYNSWLKNGGIDAKSPDGTAASFSKANKFALQLANSSIFYELASKELINSVYFVKRPKRQIQSMFDQNNVIEALQTLDVSNFIAQKISSANIASECEDSHLPCNINTPFRSLSGRCNNIENTNWGRSLTTFSRLLPPQYEDGVSRPRQSSVSGAALPNPRLISTVIHPDISNLHTRFSLMVMQYAQFLDHDLTLTPIHKGFHESIPSCRKCNAPQTVHPECNPFPVPPGDHYYPEVNVTSGEQLCFPFMRSLPGQQNIGPREQINQNTAYLDASQIYGENNCVASKLRGFSGRLNSTIHPTKGKELLPQSPFHPECKSKSGLCFIGGDDRASEQPGLTAIHTIFLREHNRIVEGLRGVNPHWNGDQLYEMARKIVVAQNQHITYNEFLPRILSWNAVNLYGLKLSQTGYYNEYNPTCNPAVFNEFAAAAFRIGHSLLRPHIPRLNANHHPVEPPLLLRDGFFKVDALLQPGILDEISRGLVATPMETLDQFITGEVTNHLFEDRRIPFSGIDLIALNIQRGRDHGLPSYNNYRALCNLKRARTWQDLSREIPPEVIARMKKIYQSVEDIDLFPGAMTERPLQGGLVGPTLGCIIGIQFRQLRKCDRFWYENNGPSTRFTEAQLNEIRKTTLAKIVCENLEIQGEMQRAAFDLPTNFLNPRVPCQSMPQIDLGKWRENAQECFINGKTLKIGESSFPSPCTSCVCTTEGSQCASLRITDCLQLLKEWTEAEIRNDEICSSQCGDFLQSKIFTGLTPPGVKGARSVPGKTFKFPDISSI